MPKTIHIPAIDIFDEELYQFVTTKPTDITVEHSLISLSLWEAKWHISFLSASEKNELTTEQIQSYLEFMTIGRKPDPNVYKYMPIECVEEIFRYIADPQTATTISGTHKTPFHPIITNEVLYYQMCAYQIPFDPCEKWHLNRLITLIRVCEEKNNPKKKSKQETAMDYARLNEMRRAKYHTKG